MTREEAAMKLSFHIMQCGLLMPIGWVDNNGEGSELFEAVRMAQDALREKDVNVHTNADRIRAMSDEELAEFLCGVYDDECCGVYQNESGKFICGTTIIDYDQYKIADWLKQPAEV